jgi:sugar/nucleoside kinase (ribokinase family)
MDIVAFVPDSLLEELQIPKGIMHLIEEDQSRQILERLSEFETVAVPGGSCANTMSLLAMLGGKPVYTGTVCSDEYGEKYSSKLEERGVAVLIHKKTSGLTGTSIVLTTEDAERTMNTHLGVCQQFNRENVAVDVLKDSKIFHCTGYQWDTPEQKEAIEFAMTTANENGIAVSFDIADPFCIQRNVDDFKRIISDHVTILFGNMEEAKILTGCDEPVAAGEKILEMGADTAIVKVGSKGSYVFKGSEVIKIDVYTPPRILDSTGCGDTYGGGFLYGYANGLDLEKCGRIASYTAAQTISVPGVQFEALDFDAINRFIREEIM